MTDRIDPVDLSALDPTRDTERFESIVGAIRDRAADELTARRERHSAIVVLAQWRRPMLAAAAVVALVAGTVLTRVQSPAVPADAIGDEVGQAIGVPEQLAEWLRQEQLPTAADLIEVF